MTMIPFSVIFLAGGSGSRMGSVIPKQYLSIHGKPLALYSFNTLISMPELQEMVVVCEPQYESLFQNSLQGKKIQLKFASPGRRRQDSVFNGMQMLEEDNPLVCIHDSARPLIETSLVRQLVQTANNWDAAVIGVKTKSIIKICDGAQVIIDTPDQASLWEVQTPQVIRLNLLREGFEYAQDHQLTVADDGSLVELIGRPVKVVEGSYANIKLTTPEDLPFVEQMLEKHALL